MTDEAVPHKRRVRYAGKHPRRFEEKYKELNPGQHGLELQKVLDRGQTPAGMHRSICMEEILQLLAPQPGEVGLDAGILSCSRGSAKAAPANARPARAAPVARNLVIMANLQSA